MNDQTSFPNANLPWLLYGALGFSQLILIFGFEKYIYIAEVEAVESIVYILGSLAFVISVISHFFYNKAISVSVSEEDLMALIDYRKAIKDNDFTQKSIIRENREEAGKHVFYILSWWLGEFVVILGMGGYYLGLIKPYNYYFFAAGIALHILHMPKSKPKQV